MTKPFDLLKEMDNFVYDSSRDRLVYNALKTEVEQDMLERALETADFYKDMERELDCE
jgi:hypothetical protein